MKNEQYTIFGKIDKPDSNKVKNTPKEYSRISEGVMNSFNISSIPFLGCDFELIYPLIARLVPPEKISFTSFPIATSITCEIICAGICHQMNWDYLRQTVFNKTNDNPKWIAGSYLENISVNEVEKLFALYSKPERIRKEERAAMLHSIGSWILSFESTTRVFMNASGCLLSNSEIRSNLLSCEVFSNDPEEKKMQLLLQKLSAYEQLKGLSQYCKPAIDYHLIRCYLRRGLLIPRNKYAKDYIHNESSMRKENTIAAIRQLCSQLMIDISHYTGLDIVTVNQIEWHIGRSICVQNDPDCFLVTEGASWLKPTFSQCPFFDSCTARHFNNNNLKTNEPSYSGSSY